MPTSFNAARGGAQAAQRWVSGRVYGLDAIVWSPTSNLLYRRIVAGAGSTDPSSDGTNWVMFGPSARRQLVRGVIQLVVGNTSGTYTLSTPVLNTLRTRLTWLGRRGADVPVTLVLTNTTTLTVQASSAVANDVFVSFELDEEW